MGLPFPVETTIAGQQVAVESLGEIVSRVDEARWTQRSAEQDVAALISALLDRAFQGELGVGDPVTAAGAV